jgi:hypothetical protein
VIKRSNLVSLAVLLFSLSIGIASIIPALFPALYGTTVVEPSILVELGFYEDVVQPFEKGIFFIPVIITSIIISIIFLILKFKSIKISSFNVSKKKAIIGMIIILIIFTSLSYEKIISDEKHMDWFSLEDGLNNWPPEEFYFTTHVRMFLLTTSFAIFGNYRVIPFLASVTLLIVAYLFTKKITNNRFAGLISSVVILQSDLFLSFSSIATYTIFWSLFYLLSIYLVIHRAWYISPVSYVLALMSKTLVVTFLPLSIFFMMNANISIKKKITIITITLLIMGSGILIVASPESYVWNWNEFWVGFTSLSYQMRFDPLIVVLLLPTIVGLFFISKKNTYANSISIMISGILLTNPLLVAITTITSMPYRFIPLVIFMAIGIGMIIANGMNSEKEDSIVEKNKVIKKKKAR